MLRRFRNFFCTSPLALTFDRIFGELENIRSEKADSALDRVLQCADRGHDRDDRKDADRDAEHGQRGAQFVRAEGRQRHLNDLTK